MITLMLDLKPDGSPQGPPAILDGNNQPICHDQICAISEDENISFEIRERDTCCHVQTFAENGKSLARILCEWAEFRISEGNQKEGVRTIFLRLDTSDHESLIQGAMPFATFVRGEHNGYGPAAVSLDFVRREGFRVLPKDANFVAQAVGDLITGDVSKGFFVPPAQVEICVIRLWNALETMAVNYRRIYGEGAK